MLILLLSDQLRFSCFIIQMENFYAEEYQYHQYDDDDNSSGVVDDNFTCERINISNTRSNSSLTSSSNYLSGGSRIPLKNES